MSTTNSRDGKSMSDMLSSFAFKKTPKKSPTKATTDPLPQKTNEKPSEPPKSTKQASENDEVQLKKVKLSEPIQKEEQDTSMKIENPPLDQDVPKRVTLEIPETKPKQNRKPKPQKTEKKPAQPPKVKILEINDLADLSVFKQESPPPQSISKSGIEEEEEEPIAEGGEEFPTTSGQFSDESMNLPDWAKEANIKDKKGRRPDEEGYDSTTLYIPPKALDKMGKTIKKYWEVKSQHYDKVVFVRFGKVYCAYHRDAIICHTLIGSSLYNRHGSSAAFVYPNKIARYCQRLLDIDYKSVLVEPVPIEGEKEESELQIYQVITKGTYVEPNPNNLTPRYCLFLTVIENQQEWGFTYVDTTTHEFFMGEFKDTPNRTRLKSLLLRVMPVEITFRMQEIPREVIVMMKNLYWKPTITPLTLLKPRYIEVVINKLDRYFDFDEEPSPDLQVLKGLVMKVKEYLSTQEEQKDIEHSNSSNPVEDPKKYPQLLDFAGVIYDS